MTHFKKYVSYALMGFILQSCGTPAGGGQPTNDAAMLNNAGSDSTDSKPTAKPSADAEPKPTSSGSSSSTAIRKEITNVENKITRAQANLNRKENLRDSMRSERNSTRSTLAEAEADNNTSVGGSIGGGGISGNSSSTRDKVAELKKLLTIQEAEIKVIEDEILAIAEEIKALELQVDELTKKLNQPASN